jgi:hypothetical protein
MKNKISFFVALIVLASSLYYITTKAQSSTIDENFALELALSYSMDDGLIGGAIQPPQKMYGQTMTYNEAFQFVSGRAIEPNTKQFEKRNLIVWLVVLEGEFIEHVPASPDGTIPASEVIHEQMTIIMEGNTGDLMRKTLISPDRKLPATLLPILERTDSEQPAPSIIVIEPQIIFVTPFPTLTALP